MTRLVARTLGYVNKLRTQQGKRPLKKLPKGEPIALNRCPIANALGVGAAVCDGNHIVPAQIEFIDKAGKLVKVYPPQYVNEFIKRFDDKKYPELIDS